MGEHEQISTIRKWTIKFFKGLAITVAVLLVLALAAYVTLDLYLDSYLKSKLEKKVQQASNGLYHLDIGYLHISLIDFSVVAKDIQFTTDSSRYGALQKKKDKHPDYYHISTNKFYISDLNLWPLLWGGGVHIPNVMLSGPEIYALTHPDHTQQKQKKPFLLTLHQKLEKYVSWLTIDSILVEQGKLQYVAQSDSGKTSVEVPTFGLSFHKVLLDEEASKDTSRVLYTKNIFLKAKDGIKLTTSKFTLTSPAVTFSTAQGTTIHNLVYATDSSQHTKADIRVSKIQFGYLDWHKLLHNEGVYIPTIYIEQPSAEIRLGKSSDKQTTSKHTFFAFHKQLTPIVPAVRIDSILLNKGNLHITHTKPTSGKDLTAQNVDLTLHDVLIDSAAANDPRRFLYTKDIRLEVHDYLQGGNDVYMLKANYLKASTLQGLQAKDVTLLTDEKAQQHRQSSVYELRIPSISAEFTNWGALTDTAGVSIPTVRITRPQAKIIVRSLNQNKNKESQQALHQMISPYLPWLRIDKIQVEKGNLTYVHAGKKGEPAYTIRNFYLTGKDLLIDSATANNEKRFFYTKEVILEIKDYAQVTKNNQKLNIGYLRASNQTGATFQNLTLSKEATPSRNSEEMYYQVTVPFIQIIFRDWYALWQGEGAHVPLVEVTNLEAVIYSSSGADAQQRQGQKKYPQKNVLTLHKQLSPFIPWLAIDSVCLSGGYIQYVQDKDSSNQATYTAGNLNLTMAGVRIDSAAAHTPERVFYSQQVQIAVKDSLTFTNAAYQMQADSVYASTTKGIGISNLQLTPRASQLTENREQPLYKVNIPEFYTSFTDWNNFMQANEVHVPTVQITKPSFRLIASTPSGSGSDADANTGDDNTASQEDQPQQNNSLFAIQDVITRFVPVLRIDSITVDKGNFCYVQHPEQHENFTSSAENIYLTFQKFRIDSSADRPNSKVLFAENIQFRVADFRHLLKDSLYSLTINNFNGSTQGKNLYLDRLAMKPQYAVKEFFEKAGGQQDVLELEVEGLHAWEINYEELIHQQNILAGYIKSDGIKLNIFRDRRVPPLTSPKPLPLDAFRQMDTYVRLDRIFLTNGYIAYTEIPLRGSKPGSMYFEDIRATIQNFTNDSTLVSLTNPVEFQASALLMGAGKTNLTVTLPLFNDTNLFQYNGSIGQMDLKALNPMLENTAFMRIRSGKLDELTVQADADQDMAKGIMCAFYKDFEVELLDHEPGEEDDLWKDVATFMANKFVLRENNRRKSYNFNPGYIEVNRQKTKTTFNYFWSTLRTGIYGSIGYIKAKKILPFL